MSKWGWPKTREKWRFQLIFSTLILVPGLSFVFWQYQVAKFRFELGPHTDLRIMTVAQETVDPKNELFPRLEETPKTVVIEVIGVRVATNLASLESDFNSINVLIIARMQDFVDSRLDGYHLKIYTEFAKDNPIPLSIRGIKPELRWLSYHEGEVNYLIDPSFEREPYDTKFRENPQIQPREFSNCIKTEFKTWEEATPLLNDSLVFLIWKDGYGVALNDPPQN